MLFSSDYSMKMPIGQAVLTAVIGILTVLAILAVISLLIMCVSFIIRKIEGGGSKKTESETPAEPERKEVSTAVDLIGVDEPTAAVIMAIVSDQSGIPLEKLRFKSIKLLEEEK